MTDKKTAASLALAALLAVASSQVKAEDWSGFYVGVAGGAQFDSSKWVANSVGPNNGYGVDAATANQRFSNTHGRAGGLAGWNMMLSPDYLVGIEGDVYATLNGKVNRAGLPGVTYYGLPTSDFVAETQNYDASIRGRIGSFVLPDTLVFLTGGAAIRDRDIKGVCAGDANSWCGVAQTETQSKSLVGYIFGVGVETKLADNWTGRLDYRYEGFGDTNITLFSSPNQGVDQIGGKVSLNSQAVTVGVVYHFGM